MLQIRLSKGSAGDSGGAPAKTPPAVETVTVACPDHLVLADLPVAKSIGAVTSSGSTFVRSVGRRSRRHLGERVHFCVRCDFPIAIYGRLVRNPISTLTRFFNVFCLFSKIWSLERKKKKGKKLFFYRRFLITNTNFVKECTIL